MKRYTFRRNGSDSASGSSNESDYFKITANSRANVQKKDRARASSSAANVGRTCKVPLAKALATPAVARTCSAWSAATGGKLRRASIVLEADNRGRAHRRGRRSHHRHQARHPMVRTLMKTATTVRKEAEEMKPLRRHQRLNPKGPRKQPQQVRTSLKWSAESICITAAAVLRIPQRTEAQRTEKRPSQLELKTIVVDQCERIRARLAKRCQASALVNAMETVVIKTRVTYLYVH